jgi:DNA polymerase I-like protein with 3'-5' exonuclease and polymerase domains
MVKGLWLGLTYNMKKNLLAHDLWYKLGIKFSKDWKTHVFETGKLIKRFFRKYPLLKRHIRRQIRTLEKKGQIIAPDGAIRHLPHDGPDTPMYWHLENQAVNFPIQRFASSVTGSALVDYEAALLKHHKISYADWHNALLNNPFDLPCSPIINEVHDELDQDMHPKDGKQDLDLLVHCAEKVPTLRKLVPEFDVPLKVKVTVNPTWT